MILPKFAEWAWTVGPFLWGRSSVPRLEDFHTEALRLGPSLLLTPVQVAFGAGHGFVAEDQLDSVGVNAALCQRRTPALLQTVNVAHRVGDRRLAPSYSRLGRQLTVVSKQPINLPLAQRSAFLAYDKQRSGLDFPRRKGDSCLNGGVPNTHR